MQFEPARSPPQADPSPPSAAALSDLSPARGEDSAARVSPPSDCVAAAARPEPHAAGTKRPHPDSQARPDSGLPYPHQVGGHGQLTKTRSGFLLKPSSEKEHAFYNYIHSDRLPDHLRWLRNVTPKYYGHQQIPHVPELSHTHPNDPAEHDQETDNSLNKHDQQEPNLPPTVPEDLLTNSTEAPLANGLNHPDPSADDKGDNPKPPAAPSGPSSSHIPPPLPETAIHIQDPDDPDPDAGLDMLASDYLSHPSPADPSGPYPDCDILRWRFNDSPHTVTAEISPWAVQMDNRKKSRRKTHRRPRPCIRLGDINIPFMLPCILDCKMGVRHYDDDASDEKRRRHIHKANTTTSGKCGVRYTGMQSFKRGRKGGVYDVKDKYHGRTLAEKDLIPMATWFFHNDHELRTDCIKLMLDKLKNLRPYLMAQNQFYFYSSSLLLVYEGASPDLAPPRVEVRMIDFAHTVLSNGKRDDGYVRGLDYLIGLLTTILQNDKTGKTEMAPSIFMQSASKTASGVSKTSKADLQDDHDYENGNHEAAGTSSTSREPNGLVRHMEVS